MKIAGILILCLPFIGLFIYLGKQIGYGLLLKAIFIATMITAAIIIWSSTGTYLIRRPSPQIGDYFIQLKNSFLNLK